MDYLSITKRKYRRAMDAASAVLLAQRTEYSLLRTAAVVTALTAAGVAGRAALQFVPSVEPLTPMAVLVGFFFGPVAGFVSGAAGFAASNFAVWGGQGVWTPFQSLGAGMAGAVGGMFGLGRKGRAKALAATVLGVAAYEVLVTFGMSMLSMDTAFVAAYALTSLPFSAVHIVSSLGFASFFYEFKDGLGKLRGGKLVEQEILGLRRADGAGGVGSGALVPFAYARKSFGGAGGDSGERDRGVRAVERDVQDG